MLNEVTAKIDYDRLGVDQARNILDRAPSITPSEDRPVHLGPTHFLIESSDHYLRQKPWWKKRDPWGQLLNEELEAARTAEEVARAAEVLEGGEGSSQAAEAEAAAEAAEKEDEALLETSVSLCLAFWLQQNFSFSFFFTHTFLASPVFCSPKGANNREREKLLLVPKTPKTLRWTSSPFGKGGDGWPSSALTTSQRGRGPPE